MDSIKEQLADILAKGDIGLLGFGVEIAAWYRWMITEGDVPADRIVVSDQTNRTGLDPATRTIFGDDYLSILDRKDVAVVFKAPGIPRTTPEIERAIAERGPSFVQSSLSLWLSAFRNRTIGITGTKGKTTTSNLISHLLNTLSYDGKTFIVSSSDRSVYVGNSSNRHPVEDLGTDTNDRWYVCELSSFQLADLGAQNLSPAISIITNLDSDHQDHHKSHGEYWGAKDAIFSHQTSDDTVCLTTDIVSKSPFFKSGKRTASSILMLDDELAELIAGMQTPLLGRHNISNCVQAVQATLSALSRISGHEYEALRVSLIAHPEALTSALSAFSVPQHRLTLVATTKTPWGGRCQWIDNSSATNALAGSQAFIMTREDKIPALILMGGATKHDDLTPLARELFSAESAELFNVVLFGEQGSRIREAVTESQIPIAVVSSLREYLQNGPEKELSALAHVNGNPSIVRIILNPAAASFDEFKNYEERGEVFTDTAKSSL